MSDTEEPAVYPITMAAEKRNGRPPLNKHRRGTATCVAVRLDDVTYDELYALHRSSGFEISALIRTAIEAHLLDDRRKHAR